VSLIAARGVGIADLVAAIDDHRRTDSRERRLARARAQILSLAQTQLRTQSDLDGLAEAVVDGQDDPYSAAERLLSRAGQRQD
jgi:LAO/AO transport system kinase